ncbi:PREDICTED: uncharacterized protein LOC106814416 [Priapulus caudatus]|uniref:Uncharacterized protein LOC106814416 n=1 Tax=Priapulus caudatus TaxID=37621 RepID=A0ABM1EPU6_PRICU|nr:PREDICTED: uncharacterized protein LOC106814416 [Priapulus caudatus]
MHLPKVLQQRAASDRGLVTYIQVNRDRCPAMLKVPSNKWLLHIYSLDVMKRADKMKASITSVLGSILKSDSTRKVAKKLAGHVKNAAAWCTNIGNEYGQVLISVMAVGEGRNLRLLCQGSSSRYSVAAEPPPQLMYVDRDCCTENDFHEYWPELQVRLDIWHFMRRFARGCTTKTHPLYAMFMRQLGACIFEWDAGDLPSLVQARKQESSSHHKDAQALANLKLDELAMYCRRKTRGVEQTTELLVDLICAYKASNRNDTTGVPLIDPVVMDEIWRQQCRHIPCIQDTDNVQLYTKLAVVDKGVVKLTQYRCARVLSSLPNAFIPVLNAEIVVLAYFNPLIAYVLVHISCILVHLRMYLIYFISGTTMNATHFQAMLLDGICRWNADRERDAVNADRANVIQL